jgi:pimeloyl-ACP methyl ester carboxylesterase
MTNPPHTFRYRLTLLGSILLMMAPCRVLKAQQPARPPNSASLQSLQIPSHGELLNGFAYLAGGSGPHATVVLLHGFPGNERNLDLAQDIRRAGWNVVYLDYRGSWGSPGDFSFSHCIEDVAAAVAYLREPSVATMLRIDLARIVLIGHSMGGFLAIQAASTDPGIAAVAVISPVDLGGMIPASLKKEQEPFVLRRLAESYIQQGIAPLQGCTPEGLARDNLTHAAEWSFSSKVMSLKSRPVLVVSADDGYAMSSLTFATSLRQAGDSRVVTLHLTTDHSYSDQRVALSTQVLTWLANLP